MASAAPKYEQWLALDQVRELSRSTKDPETFRATREDAFERFLTLPLEPNPLYRGYGYFSNVDLTGIDPLAAGAPVPRPPRLSGAVQIVHDVAGTHVALPPELRDAGVRVTSFSEVWGGSPEALAGFLRGSETATDRLSALATAVLNRGYALELPDGLAEPVRVQDIAVLSVPHEALSVRRSIRAGRSSQLLLTEEVYSTAGGPEHQRLYASSTDLDLGERSKAVVLTVHAPDLRTVSLYRRSATTGPASRLGWLWNGLGGVPHAEPQPDRARGHRVGRR